MTLLALEGVRKQLGRYVILDNLTLTIHEGEILGIVGVNGSGKTTLLKLMIGYFKQDIGSITYRGQPLKKVKKVMKREIGFAAQENSFYPKLTVEENVRYFGSLYGLEKHAIIEHTERALAFLDLLQHRHQLAGHLSGGMQRRLEMACSIVHDPKLLILDEPTEDLDPVLRRDILHLIKRLHALGTTVVITSHLLDDVEDLCTRVALLHDRRILRVGKIDDFRSSYRWREEIHLQTSRGDYKTLIRDLRIKEFYVEGHKLVIFTNQADKLLHHILGVLDNEGDRLVYLDVKRPSLQEMFEEITTNKRWL
jgi:ABC-2 type transport system ATP-binding protein